MNMTDEESDIFEHELYVIEVWSLYERSNPPDFYRSPTDKESLHRLIDEDCILTAMNFIRKTPILSRATLYSRLDAAEEQCKLLNHIRIGNQIRKVDVRLKDE